jgi:hypothetical protein
MPKTNSKKVTKQDLVDIELSIIATALFSLKKIEMKDDLAWRIKLELKTKLDHSFREYKARFSVNEAPFEMRIEDLEKKKYEVETEEQLFPDQKKTQLKNIDSEIKEVERELEDMREMCPDIEFDGTIEELKYKDGNTIIVMIFPSLSLAEINEKRRELANHYKIELIRE